MDALCFSVPSGFQHLLILQTLRRPRVGPIGQLWSMPAAFSLWGTYILGGMGSSKTRIFVHIDATVRWTPGAKSPMEQAGLIPWREDQLFLWDKWKIGRFEEERSFVKMLHGEEAAGTGHPRSWRSHPGTPFTWLTNFKQRPRWWSIWTLTLPRCLEGCWPPPHSEEHCFAGETPVEEVRSRSFLGELDYVWNAVLGSGGKSVWLCAIAPGSPIPQNLIIFKTIENELLSHQA